MTLQAGTRFGPYAILAKLGEGGMGQVYRARDAKLNRDVAIKILRPAVAADPDRLMRFEREAQALAALNHPNIAQIFGVVESPAGELGTTALVMELVEGEDLARHVTSGPMPLAEALAVARQIALALEAAHEAGIVHRDLKPANVKVRPDATVKVLDFGLAKTLAGATPASPEIQDAANSPTRLRQGYGEASSPVTELGIILGTAAYMAPEQARGRMVDKRADIWAFGCVLYEMLTGRRAFRGEDVTEILTSVMRDTPDWQSLPADTPASIRRLLPRCLERDPKRRLRDIGDAIHEIDAAAQPDTSTVASASASSRPRWLGPVLWTALGATAAGLFAIATSGARSPAAAPSISRMTIVPPAEAPLRPDGSSPDLAISPDGRRVIYQGRRSDPEGVRLSATQFVVRDLQAFEATPLTTLGLNPGTPFLSPDGKSIGFETTVGARVTPVLAKAPLAGGEVVVLCDLAALGPLRGASWGDDGQIVFATSQRTTGLFRIASTGSGTPAPLTTPKPEAGEMDHRWPQVLGGNRGILFTIVRQQGFDVAVLPPNSTEWRVVIPGGSSARYLPTGHVVYVADGTLRGVGFDLTTLRATTDPVVLVPDVLTKTSGAADVAIAADGTLAYVAGSQLLPQSRVVWLSRNGVTALPLDPRDYRSAQLSPDGRRIAVAFMDRGSSSIWVYDIARDSFTRVSPRDSSMLGPLWSPDGTALAAWSSTDRAIVKFPAHGGSMQTLVRAENDTFYPNAWSPDGGVISYVHGLPSPGLDGVGTSPPYAVRPLAVGTGAQVESAFAPNGRWITHVSFDGTEPEIVVGPVATTDRRWPVASRGRWPVWSADGRAVLFNEANAIHRVAIDPASGQPIGRPAKVIDLPVGVTSQPFQVGPDGRFLMLERVEGPAATPEIRVVLNWFEELRAKIPVARR
jgi:eukaryotic-like serine/threonine-protein kinase